MRPAFAAAVDESGRFRQSRDAGACCGLVHRRHQSGELDWTGRITKQRDETLRKSLYEACHSILAHSRETFPQDLGHADFQVPRPEEDPRRPCGHHARHASRRRFVPSVREGRTCLPAVKRKDDPRTLPGEGRPGRTICKARIESMQRSPV
ncbi:transposase [Novosphingobium colocasiae]|uniref:transposase n=1 Tax=Novosphingobium colocasiae TaxID=1256513 RepID=UPI003571327D